MVMSKNTELTEVERLMSELRDLGPYDSWSFTYEFPGYFCYSRPNLPFNVMFTPDWQADGTLPIEVQDDEGGHCEEHSTTLPLPREGRTGKQLFDLVRPTLDKLAKLLPPAEPMFDLQISLTADEINALPKALDHVRVRMAHEHPWTVRDAAMIAISKLVAAARAADEPTLNLQISLTADEINALPKALDHVRAHMAQEHPWSVRDAAMIAIGKLVSASRTDEARSRGAKAEQLFRTRVDQGGLRIIGVPEALPSAQEPAAVVLRVDIRVPATLIDETHAVDRNAMAAQILHTLFKQDGLRIIGVPEASPSAQEPGSVVLHFDVRVPAALIAGGR